MRTTIAMSYGALPEPDIVDHLLAQHTTIRDLMLTVMSTHAEERTRAFRDLVHLLSVHETVEEEVVHPVARRQAAAGEQIVDDRLREEHDAKAVLAELEGMDPGDPAFMALFLRLREAVITHAVSEQRYEFNNLRQYVPTAQLRAMRTLAMAAAATAPTHPHAGVESAKANLLLGPPVAIADRARDAVRRLRGSGG